MPRLDHQVTLEGLFSWQERMIVSILVEQLNILRAQAGLPLLTQQDLRQEARAYIRDHPRTTEGS